MKRKIYNKLLEWKQKRANKEALLIDGARRVGKSYIVRAFAENEYKSYMLIDFSQITASEKDVFDHYLSNVDELFNRLQLLRGVRLHNRQSLVIFDEVQHYPAAREAIKWLVADGRYDYIETGSLVSLRKNTKGITIPSEEAHLNMYPMDFEEFLWALGEEQLMPFISQCYERKEPLGNALHRKALDYFRTYMVVGGMPQAVQEYIDTKDFTEVDHIKRNILALYRQDIYQYAGDDAPKVIQVWDTVVSQLMRKKKRFRISDLKKNARFRDYRNAFFWLMEARVINPCYAATEPSIGLKLNRDDARYKLYLSDTGLLLSHAFDEREIHDNELYKKLILGKLELKKGMFAENVVAQMLVANNQLLYYFSQTDSNDRKNEIEIDFLVRKPIITSKHNICPIEVKSTQRYTTTSLNKFRDKFAPYLHTSYVLHSGDLKVQDNIVYLPLYMTMLL